MNNEPKYISLQEVAKYCHYSQEYLSLRARQGKLKAVKFGRNWVTKKEWLEEYLKKVEEYNNNLKTQKTAVPPKNLPVADYRFGTGSIKSPAPLVRSGFIVALVFILLVAGCFLGKENFKNVYQGNVPQVVGNISLAAASIGDVFKEYGQWLGKSISEWFSSQTEEIVQNYWLLNNFLEEKIRTLSQLFRKPEKIVEEKLIPKPDKEGMVVIPSTEKDQEVKEKIKESFSDEVKVEPTDKTSGIITPIFKEGEGQKYLYILVPIKN